MRLPLIQFIFGAVIVIFGAYLIGRWAVGIALAVIGTCLLFDALFRDVQTQRQQPTATTFEDVIGRARKSP